MGAIMQTEVNVPLLRKAVEWAEAEAAKPAIDCRWDQSWWLTAATDRAVEMFDDNDWVSVDHVDTVAAHCGTAYCIAGYVAQLLDPRFAATSCVDGMTAAAKAADALGVNKHDALDSLFDANNTIEDVRRIAEDIAGERL